jgi:hypothetical protein
MSLQWRPLVEEVPLPAPRNPWLVVRGPSRAARNPWLAARPLRPAAATEPEALHRRQILQLHKRQRLIEEGRPHLQFRMPT